MKTVEYLKETKTSGTLVRHAARGPVVGPRWSKRTKTEKSSLHTHIRLLYVLCACPHSKMISCLYTKVVQSTSFSFFLFVSRLIITLPAINLVTFFALNNKKAMFVFPRTTMQTFVSFQAVIGVTR